MSDLIDRQAAIDALDVLCQEHRYKIPGKGETYSQYNEAWQDALDRAEGAIGNLPSAQLEIVRCKDCEHNRLPATSANADCEIFYGMTDQYGFCHMAERRTDDQT